MSIILSDPPATGDRPSLEAYLAEMRALPDDVENRGSLIHAAERQLELHDAFEASGLPRRQSR